MQIDVCDRLYRFPAHAVMIDQANAADSQAQRLAADEEVSGNRHRRHHRGVLIDRFDAETHGDLGRSDLDPLSLNANLTLVGLQNAGEYFDQRRFPGAVVAHEPDHLARLYVESDALQRMDARVPFVNVPYRDQRRDHINPPL